MARIETGKEARQGPRGKPVLYILIGTLILCAIAAVAVLSWQGANAPKDRSSQSQDAAREQVTGSPSGNQNPAPSSNSSSTPGGNPAYPQPAQPKAQ